MSPKFDIIEQPTPQAQPSDGTDADVSPVSPLSVQPFLLDGFPAFFPVRGKSITSPVGRRTLGIPVQMSMSSDKINA